MREKRPLRIAVSGASGLIGTELVRQLRDDGHHVVRLVRRQPSAPDEVNWAPTARILDTGVIDEVDAVVNLSGSPLGRVPWTPKYKRELRQSRIQTTQALAEAMNMASSPPEVFLSASATGIYGDRPAERLTEESTPGEGFLATLVSEWEQATRLAPDSTRVVNLRTGVVIGHGDTLSPLRTLTRLGLGARIGTGGDVWPWISLYDEAAAIRHLLSSRLHGPVNLAGPTPATSDRITAYLARRLRRSYGLTVPPWAIGLGLQDAGRELLMTSQLVLPNKLVADGFTFRHETAQQAIDASFLPRVNA